MRIKVTYNTAYETSQVESYEGAVFHVDEAGTLFIGVGGKYKAAYAKGVWRQVNEV